MPVTRIVIFAALILLLSSSIRADSFAVIFGSFVNKEFAEAQESFRFSDRLKPQDARQYKRLLAALLLFSPPLHQESRF